MNLKMRVILICVVRRISVDISKKVPFLRKWPSLLQKTRGLRFKKRPTESMAGHFIKHKPLIFLKSDDEPA